ncbi:MAG: Holliday junction resolvase RuvX [Bacteroidales bacterium]|nr:Holliday junction resolvase RuvX [Bacteroidales bacterium]
MGRIIAIDYGRKRTGLAVSDPLKIIAGGLTTVVGNEVIPFLKEYVKKEPVECIVIGYPKQMNNKESENMRWIRPFVAELKKNFPAVTIEYYDERFTSVIAHKAMIDAGLKKSDRRNKALVDELSAVIILQDYLEYKR